MIQASAGEGPMRLSVRFGAIVRADPDLMRLLSVRRKARRAQAIWPEVTVIPWETGAPPR